jgi:serine/threonine-protein kinase
MEPERWRRIDEVFQAALNCEPGRRDAFLDEACAGDASLRKEIDSLLASYERGGFTGAPAFADGLRMLERNQSDSFTGRRIGPYQVIREIGRGGMGAVYLAARADQAYRKEVAIKLIHRGLDTDSVVQRFCSERQILASLEHPNITRLLDGGATEDGLPYFVMEHIQGEPIDKYCETRRLNIVERLRLFQSVCGAVQYAHQNLVVHRDIKPGNVLVTAEGVPRLLDFGIAKLLNPGLGPGGTGGALTAAGLMTPQYASPEQVRGETITTASDVYSLGVLLYELLTGRRPYRLTSTAAAEVERAICYEEPEKPSAAAGRSLRRRLRGDLDNIVLMAMRKEPPRRYRSVEQFAEDIRRHLNGLPVIARPDTAGYRAAKFVARHKAGVAAAALIFLTLAAGIVATLWQAKVAATERDRARLQTAKAERINAFLQDMLSYSNPTWASPNWRKDPNVKVSEVVEEAAGRAEAELAGQPEVLAEVQRTLGNVHSGQARWNQAESLLRAALEKQIRLYGPDHHESARTSHDLAVVLFRMGRLAEAETLFRKALDVYRGEVQRGSSDVSYLAGALGDLGAMLGQKGDTKAAELYLREGLQVASKLTGKERAIVAMVNNELAGVLYRGGDLNEVERLLRTAIEEYRKLPAGSYSEMAIGLTNLGTLLLTKGKYAEAEPLIREGLEINRKVLGNEHFTTAGNLARLADLLYIKSDYQQAEDAARESLQILNRTLPRGNLAFASPLMALGLILNKTGRPRQAEAHLREALGIRTRLLPGGHQLIGTSEGALGECLATQKMYAEAEPLLLSSHRIMQSTAGERDPRTAEAVRRLTSLYESWGKPAEAARYRALSAPVPRQ